MPMTGNFPAHPGEIRKIEILMIWGLLKNSHLALDILEHILKCSYRYPLYQRRMLCPSEIRLLDPAANVEGAESFTIALFAGNLSIFLK
jgi:hypothetical protein